VLLNSYLRETGAYDPRIVESGQQDNRLFENGGEMMIHLPSLGRKIRGTLTYFSVMGQHAYGSSFYEVQRDGMAKRLNVNNLIPLLLDELDCSTAGGAPGREQMRERIENSIHKMMIYIEYALQHTRSDPAAKWDFIRSEQSLLLGHPFHPFPKSSEGFGDHELPYFSPEMGASFQLNYIALRSEYVQQQWLPGEQEALDPTVIGYARQRLGSETDRYKLLPMHPWQVKYMLRQPIAEQLMLQGDLIDLGALGPVVYPTSSVRTVWDKTSGYGYKLPLHVCITNLVRDNTLEQCKRTLDAARVIQAIRKEVDSDRFKVLLETGYSSIQFEKSLFAQSEQEAAEMEQMAAGFNVIYRPMELPKSHTYVMAALLETFPGEADPILIAAIRQAGNGQVPDLALWLEAYLRITMLPLLRLFADKGISFEAHLQNSLLAIKDGMPACYYVRDLEGVSIHRSRAEAVGWIGTLIRGDSPVLYEEAEAWMRTKYYFFVNHLGSLIHTIAAYEQADELRYWGIVQELLKQEKQGAQDHLIPYLDDLLLSPHLPAKANLTSCFQSRGERPLFVSIPNPMNISEVQQ
jgi:siderophore synthetase component